MQDFWNSQTSSTAKMTQTTFQLSTKMTEMPVAKTTKMSTQWQTLRPSTKMVTYTIVSTSETSKFENPKLETSVEKPETEKEEKIETSTSTISTKWTSMKTEKTTMAMSIDEIEIETKTESSTDYSRFATTETIMTTMFPTMETEMKWNLIHIISGVSAGISLIIIIIASVCIYRFCYNSQNDDIEIQIDSTQSPVQQFSLGRIHYVSNPRIPTPPPIKSTVTPIKTATVHSVRSSTASRNIGSFSSGSTSPATSMLHAAPQLGSSSMVTTAGPADSWGTIPPPLPPKGLKYSGSGIYLSPRPHDYRAKPFISVSGGKAEHIITKL